MFHQPKLGTRMNTTATPPVAKHFRRVRSSSKPTYTLTRTEYQGRKVIKARSLPTKFSGWDDAEKRAESLGRKLPNSHMSYWDDNTYIVPFARGCKVTYSIVEHGRAGK
ncbi:hypothetical protein SEA_CHISANAKITSUNE_67 [Gordonia phage ChisanaKitsune]|uniref:Uncharacterized protein n=1 Tax=Gordonia phage ChisanaKitsune TaxID=2871538 RepID=A0AAE7XF28_9CAUD|nr:hypothetical protein PQD15_gp067 [Gordonia phage ChisanaKitsune]QZE10836.1 hypothetical protein SEA_CHISANAKITSUNE_67 [Gordonia phage ChisanaKitsune]